jgi:hypothetical protein
MNHLAHTAGISPQSVAHFERGGHGEGKHHRNDTVRADVNLRSVSSPAGQKTTGQVPLEMSRLILDHPNVLSQNLKVDPIKPRNLSHGPNRGRPVGVRRWTWPQRTMPLEIQMPWRETIRLILLAMLIAALGTAAIKILVEQLS